jgi:hypothetical protein
MVRLHHACGRGLVLALLGASCAAPARAQSAPPALHARSVVGATAALAPALDAVLTGAVSQPGAAAEGLGLSEVSPGRVDQRRVDNQLAVRHYVSGRRDPDTGFDLRYQWRDAMTTVVAVHPDFSIVDGDLAGIGFSRSEKYVADRRPFFRDGADFFGSREMFHSGQIDSFDIGVKTFGRVEDYQVGVLAVTTADGKHTNYVGRVAREVAPAFNVSATLGGREHDDGNADTLQFNADGRIGSHLRLTADTARSAGDGTAPGGRSRGEVVYRVARFSSGVWADRTDPEFLAATGFLASDVMGTVGRGTYASNTRGLGRWAPQADVSVAYDLRDTLSGLPQRKGVSVYAGVATAAHVRLNTGVTTGVYRPRGSRPGEWTDALNDDRYYMASAFYESPSGRFGYGTQYSRGVAGVTKYDSIAPSMWVAPTASVSASYSFERATHGDVQHQHVLAATWHITAAQSMAARWVDYDGGYYKLTYRRALARGVDAIGVYTADPYERSSLNVKLIWSRGLFARK